MPADFDEDKLIEQAKTDPEAFGKLYELYVDRVYNYIYYRVGNEPDAEDLTAKVFYKALNHIPHYHNRGKPFAAWLYRISRNLVANWYRDSQRRQMVALEKVTLRGDGRETPHRARNLTGRYSKTSPRAPTVAHPKIHRKNVKC